MRDTGRFKPVRPEWSLDLCLGVDLTTEEEYQTAITGGFIRGAGTTPSPQGNPALTGGTACDRQV
jgi:hypothetical protein